MEIIKGTNTDRPRKVVLYGRHGVGKSSWACDAPKPIAIQTEDGLGDIGVDRLPLCKTLSDFKDCVNYIYTNGADYDTLIIDSVDWLEALIQKDVAQDAKVASIADIGFGRGYESAHTEMQNILSTLDMISKKHSLHIILIAHAAIKKFEDPLGDSYDRYSPALHTNGKGQGVCLTVQEWADEVLFLTDKVLTRKSEEGFNKTTTKAVGNGQRVIHSQGSPAFDAKSRAKLPDKWNFEQGLGFNTFLELVKGEMDG